MKKSEIFWQTYLNLEKELLEVAKYVYITDEITNNQLKVYSPHLADLLVRTCIEIEALSKELYFDFGGSKTRGDTSLMFDTDCLKLIDMKCNSHKKTVMITCSLFNITKDENKVFKPLKEAHKRQGTDWERAYQAVKHDRYSSISKGTILNLIHAMGALFLLNIYYRDVKLISKYLEIHKLDLSLGSSVFSIKSPDQNYVADVINGKEVNEIMESNDSPYILKYTDSSYKELVEANKVTKQNRESYLLSQPELKEEKFINIIKEGKKKEKENPHNRFMLTWELCKYRINKKIPSTLPFSERKNLFISCAEWNGIIRTINKHLSESELTEANIQSEIDQAGVFAGMELEQQLDSLKTRKAFNDGYCELVIDKGCVKYN